MAIQFSSSIGMLLCMLAVTGCLPPPSDDETLGDTSSQAMESPLDGSWVGTCQPYVSSFRGTPRYGITTFTFFGDELRSDTVVFTDPACRIPVSPGRADEALGLAAISPTPDSNGATEIDMKIAGAHNYVSMASDGTLDFESGPSIASVSTVYQIIGGQLYFGSFSGSPSGGSPMDVDLSKPYSRP